MKVHRFLELGETIEIRDEMLLDGMWVKVSNWVAGLEHVKGHPQVRRFTFTHLEPRDIIEVGDEHRVTGKGDLNGWQKAEADNWLVGMEWAHVLGAVRRSK